MFTGIIKGIGTLVDIQKLPNHSTQTHWVKLPKLCSQNLAIGASVALNGCCLTVTDSKEDCLFSFDLIEETLKKTNLGQGKVKDKLNIERSLQVGDEVGGHLMSGHIFDTVKISSIEQKRGNCIIQFELTEAISPYIFSKGFIGLDGCSLTVGEVTPHSFSVYLIPETLRQTIFQYRKIGERINLEIDTQTKATVDTVQRLLQQHLREWKKDTLHGS
ncbi:MAG: riboflavin synthase subunit alpha [Neisseriaceae bacterium]